MEVARDLDENALKRYADSGCFCHAYFGGIFRKGFLKYDAKNDVFYITNEGLGIGRIEIPDETVVHVQNRLLRDVCTGITCFASESEI